jgi:hypothetical protein
MVKYIAVATVIAKSVKTGFVHKVCSADIADFFVMTQAVLIDVIFISIHFTIGLIFCDGFIHDDLLEMVLVLISN